MENLGARTYEDFVPYCKWQSFEDKDILEVHLRGFRKDQLKVQINNDVVLMISGERPPEGNNKWRRFRQEMKVSKECLTDQIHAKFSKGVLYITMPKTTPPVKIPPQSQQNDATLGKPADISHNNNLLSKLKMKRRLVVAVTVIVMMAIGGFVTYRYS